MSDDDKLAVGTPIGIEQPTTTDEDGIGKLFIVGVLCNLCEQPLAFHLEQQIRARPPATHVIALSIAKCPCIDIRFNAKGN